MIQTQFDKKEFAAVAVILDAGRVLAVTRRGLPTDWALPGGKKSPAETLRRCATRELDEETGVVADEESIALVFAGWDAHGNEVSAFLVRGWSGLPHSKEEGVEVAWLEPSQLLDPTCTFHEYNREVLDSIARLEWR